MARYTSLKQEGYSPREAKLTRHRPWARKQGSKGLQGRKDINPNFANNDGGTPLIVASNLGDEGY